jgi:hypothetical protein
MITWNTDVNAPCCPGEIVNDDGRTLLVQTDWDYPRTAVSFGWSLRQVQRCPSCGKTADGPAPNHGTMAHCSSCDHAWEDGLCDHDGTDGTVPCRNCGCTQTDFISAAYDWLRENDGATANDPGYFSDDR